MDCNARNSIRRKATKIKDTFSVLRKIKSIHLEMAKEHKIQIRAFIDNEHLLEVFDS